MIYHSALCLFFLSLSLSPCPPLSIPFCFCLSPSLPLLFSVEIYGRMSTDLLPTPAKSHYIFNLRDLSKCIQGSVNHLNSSSLYSTLPRSLHVTVMLFFLSSSYLPFLSPSPSLSLPLPPSLPSLLGVLQADPGVIREHDHIFRLFCHECQRVFHDRLIDKTDKKYFYGILSEMSSKYFSKVLWH